MKWVCRVTFEYDVEVEADDYDTAQQSAEEKAILDMLRGLSPSSVDVECEEEEEE